MADNTELERRLAEHHERLTVLEEVAHHHNPAKRSELELLRGLRRAVETWASLRGEEDEAKQQQAEVDLCEALAIVEEGMAEPAKPLVCPGCKKRHPDETRVIGSCCNPECGGRWGTGCYHCHHPSFGAAP